MSSEHATPPVGEVAQDGHARDRLLEVDVEIDGGGHGGILTVDGEEFAIVAYVDHGADAGKVHEGLAAVFQHADDAIPLTRADGGER